MKLACREREREREREKNIFHAVSIKESETVGTAAC
jgi:hypothetical protein